jgi:hypothetical protein
LQNGVSMGMLISRSKAQRLRVKNECMDSIQNYLGSKTSWVRLP